MWAGARELAERRAEQDGARASGGNGPRGEERVQRGAGLRRAGVLGRAREQARAAWARAGGGERELGLARDGPREREGSGWVGLVSWAGFSSFPFWAEVGLGPG